MQKAEFKAIQTDSNQNAPPAAEPPPLQTARRRRHGKIAQLPKNLRDLVNHALDDGATYSVIIRQLAEHGVSANHENISNWHEGGYQDYIKDTFWREEMRARQETFTELLAGADPIQLPEAGLQLAATGACELLRDLCELNSAHYSGIDPDKFVRVSNALARLSRSILTIQQYRDTVAQNKALELKHLQADREFVENERIAVLDRTDDLFGFKSAARLRAESASAAVQGSSPGHSPPPEEVRSLKSQIPEISLPPIAPAPSSVAELQRTAL